MAILNMEDMVELKGEELQAVMILRSLLPHLTPGVDADLERDPLHLSLRHKGVVTRLVPKFAGWVSPTRLEGLEASPGTVLVTDARNSVVPLTLRRRGISFVDAGGMAYINEPGLLLYLRGLPRLDRGILAGEEPGRARPNLKAALSRKGSQVTFTLLSHPTEEPPDVRTLAQMSGVSVGTAQGVVKELRESGYLAGTGMGLVGGAKLLSMWADSFIMHRWRDLALMQMAVNPLPQLVDFKHVLREDNACIGGEYAATQADTSQLRASTLTVYAPEFPVVTVRAGRWRRDDSRPNVFIRQRFWRFDSADPVIAPAPLIYADLLASGDPRQIDEAAGFRRRDDTLARLG